MDVRFGQLTHHYTYRTALMHSDKYTIEGKKIATQVDELLAGMKDEFPGREVHLVFSQDAYIPGHTRNYEFHFWAQDKEQQSSMSKIEYVDIQDLFTKRGQQKFRRQVLNAGNQVLEAK
jgi:hypothetical protein